MDETMRWMMRGAMPAAMLNKKPGKHLRSLMPSLIRKMRPKSGKKGKS